MLAPFDFFVKITNTLSSDRVVVETKLNLYYRFSFTVQKGILVLYAHPFR